MIIAGVNTGLTRTGRPLKDGGACLLDDGQVIVAVAEERLTRHKHAGGFSRALEYCLSSAGCSLNDLDLLVVSTCAERPLEDGCDLGLSIDRTKVRGMPSHHLSHAYAAFMTSPFDEAVIMVVDNEGNILGEDEDNVYWNNRVERNSYYVGHGHRIQLLEGADDGLDDQELGPGEAYRHFTYFLGWHSYVHAGKTMGLAPLGHRDAFAPFRVFDLDAGQIRCLLVNGRESPAKAIVDLAKENGLMIGPPRLPAEPLTQRHCDVAAVIQDELERALIYKAHALYERTRIRNLCLAGGVALNCVANRKILDRTPFENLYVCPAPGDSGQCIGNALYGWTTLAGHARPVAPLGPFTGRSYHESELIAALTATATMLSWTRAANVAQETARLLFNGHVIGWFQQGSELGPRALGARSILADPRQAAMRDYLNLLVKHREPFRPYAPSILQSEAHTYFDLPQDSPFMELTGSVAPQLRHRIPAVVHVDGSSRPQTVPDSDGSFAELIREFRKLAGVPLILNTSFNFGSEPIVETPAEAVDCFLRSKLDVLVMHDFIVRRKGNPTGPGFLRWATSTPISV